MTSIDRIIGFLDDLLVPSRFDDYGPNGLQVPGRSEIATVVTGVSAGLELFDRAAALNAGLVLVHHGLFWGARGPIDEPEKRRLKLLFDADMGLAAYHLPLDAHPEVGNNAILARELGAVDAEPFAAVRGASIGVRARFADGGLEPAELVARVARVTGRAPLAFPDGPERVRTIGIVSGGAADHLDDAIAAGHYATETFGVQALGERLSRRFGIRHVFVDVPNPI